MTEIKNGTANTASKNNTASQKKESSANKTTSNNSHVNSSGGIFTDYKNFSGDDPRSIGIKVIPGSPDENRKLQESKQNILDYLHNTKKDYATEEALKSANINLGENFPTGVHGWSGGNNIVINNDELKLIDGKNISPEQNNYLHVQIEGTILHEGIHSRQFTDAVKQKKPLKGSIPYEREAITNQVEYWENRGLVTKGAFDVEESLKNPAYSNVETQYL